jgi:hypothetical protein
MNKEGLIITNIIKAWTPYIDVDVQVSQIVTLHKHSKFFLLFSTFTTSAIHLMLGENLGDEYKTYDHRYVVLFASVNFICRGSTYSQRGNDENILIRAE